MVHIERTPLKKILRAVVYRNTKKLPLSEIVEREKPDLAMTGVFYSPAKWAPVCPVKADGTVLFADQQDSYWALGWDVGADVLPILVPPGGESDCRNYVANCLLVRAGRPQQKLTYNDDVGGRRGRVAVGLTKDTWITYGASDGSSGAMTPEDLRDYMVGQGCQFAVMMDGGGKVNLYVKSENVLIQGKDPSQNLILLYLDDGETEEAPVSEKKTVCLDPGHDASNLANKSPDGTYYEHEFAARDEDGNIRVAQGRSTFRAPGERGEYEEQHRQLAETPAEIRFTKLRAPAPDTISVKSLEVLSRFIDFRGGDRK